jgi:hypothetical protein
VRRPALAAAAYLWLLAAGLRADVFILRGGDRITGQPLVEGKRSFKVKTPYGVLNIPREKVDRIVRPDGKERLVNPEPAAPVATVATLPKGKRARLVLMITGKTFWQAWDPRAGHRDPTLRFQVRLDEEVVATYVDARTDPDIPGAMVNAFSFAAAEVVFIAGKDALVLPPEQRPGRITLKVDVPAREAPRLLRVAYQGLETADDSSWRDLAVGSREIELRGEAPVFVSVEQDRGRMEFSGFPRRRMRNVETFDLDLRPEREGAEAP